MLHMNLMILCMMHMNLLQFYGEYDSDTNYMVHMNMNFMQLFHAYVSNIIVWYIYI